jgi:holliday junction DNA helicase RuvB
MNQSDAQPSANYVTCRCQYCDKGIEFDASSFDKGETRTVPCPHCGLETIIFVPERRVPPVIPDESVKLNHPSEKYFDNVKSAADAKWQYDLGLISIRENDYSYAVKCFTNAAEKGHAQAQSNLGICYLNGQGAAKDEAEGIKWLVKAAEQDNAHAEYSLGGVYFLGQGVSKNIPEALKWWHRAAAHGHANAQYNLGICYETATKGDCITQDYVEAYKWMKLAAAQGYEGAQKKCEEIVLKMNAEQIGAAEPTDQMLWKHERLTPSLFSEFIGQNRVKERLELAIAAAKHRREPLGHVLLIGAPGSGKATLANILAKAMGVNLKITSGTAVEREGDLAGLLTNLEEGDVLFIEEIHRLQKTIAENLYPAMKVFKLDIIIDQGENARSVRLNLPRFTLISSTTNKERLTPNLLSCFQIVENMDDYSVDELTAIACRFAKSVRIKIDMDAASRIANSADGTPIDVLNRLQHVRDFAHVKSSSEIITAEITAEALKMLLPTDETRESNENRTAIPPEVRREVWRRDGGKCVKCGSRVNLEYDHIIPVSKGGSNTARNIELLCEKHNREKRDSIQ